MPDGLSFGEALAIVAVPATIAAAAAIIGAVLTRRNRAEVRENAEQLSTGNDKSLGQTVHDMAQTVEVQAAFQHTNQRELLMVVDRLTRTSDRLADLEELISTHIADSTAVHDDIRRWIAGEEARHDG